MNEHPCTAEEFLQIMAEFRASRLQGFTRKDIQTAAPRPCPRYADKTIEPLLLPLEAKHAVLWRLDENRYNRWHNDSLPIFEDDYFTYRVLRELDESGRQLDLPQLYAVLARRLGPSSQCKDEWKEAFKFPLLIQLEHLKTNVLYSLAVAQWKSSLEMRFRRQHQGVEHLDRCVYQQPFEAELPRAQLNRCAAFVLELCSLLYHEDSEAYRFDFHLTVRAAHLAFGCLNGQFYTWQASDEEDFAEHAQDPEHCVRVVRGK